MTRQPKICAKCGNSFLKPYSKTVWAKTMTCSHKCGAQLSHGKDRLKAFEEKFIPEPNSGCWLWFGAVDEHGYGDAWDGAAIIGAHRLSHILYKGPIPDGGHVLHRCDNPPCVNPEHLFLGTHAINMADMYAKGRAATGWRHGHCWIPAELIDLIKSSPMRSRDLAIKYDISESHISQIRSGKSRKDG